MDQRQEMMDDAIDDVTGLEDEEEGEEVVKEVLDEIGVDLGQAVGKHPVDSRATVERQLDSHIMISTLMALNRWAKHQLVYRRTLYLKEGLLKP